LNENTHKHEAIRTRTILLYKKNRQPHSFLATGAARDIFRARPSRLILEGRIIRGRPVRLRTGVLERDHGPAAAELVGTPYPALVPKTDADGNDLAGIRLPDVTAPVATYTGWALRAEPAGANDGCDGAGQMIPFAKTDEGRADR